MTEHDPNEARRRAEMQRGQEITARNILAREFDPNYEQLIRPPPIGYRTWAEFHDREALKYLPNNRDGSPRDGT